MYLIVNSRSNLYKQSKKTQTLDNLTDVECVQPTTAAAAAAAAGDCVQRWISQL